MSNEYNEETKVKNFKTTYLLIIILISIIMISSSIGLYAWAKYRSSFGGTTTAQVAKWSFELVDGNTQTTDIIEFAVTRTDSNTQVKQGELAPGTSGEFEIGIDARGTETILEYDIELDLVNKPTNLKFYADSEKTEEILVEDNKLLLEGFMSLEDVQEIRTEKIYWDWPYETGETDEEKLANDVIDSEFLGKVMSMQIAVTGVEVLEQKIYLADVVEVGDYVNYDASSNGTYTFTSSDCLTGSSVSATISTDNSFNSSAPAQWRVLSVDKTKGIVELMAADPIAQTVTLTGGDGFVNAETVLNNIGAIYGNGKGATVGRSITVEDIEQYSSYDKTTYKNSYSSTGYYGGTREYTSGNFYKEIKDENGNVTGYETTKTAASISSPVTMTQTYYGYTASSYFSNSTIYNMIFKNSTSTSSNKSKYWLASRCVYLNSSNCNFNVRYVNSGGVYNSGVYYSDGSTSSPANRVVPVVSLKSNILTTGQDESGVWQLKVD